MLKEHPQIDVRIKRIKPKYGILGPMFREKTKVIAEALNKLTHDETLKFINEGKIKLDVNGEKIELKAEWFDVEVENVVKGKDVDVLESGDTIILIEKGG